MTRKSGKSVPMPDKAQILQFIEESPNRVGKREIARAFNIRGNDRIVLKKLLRELADDGLIERGHRKSVHKGGGLPPVTVIDIFAVDDSPEFEGDLLGRPASQSAQDTEGEPPVVRISPDQRPSGRGRPASTALGVGDRALVRVKEIGGNLYEGTVIRRLPRQELQILGVFTAFPANTEKNRSTADVQQKAVGRVQPTDKKDRKEYLVAAGDAAGAESGELVEVEPVPGPRNLRHVRVVKRLGDVSDIRNVSMISVHAKGIPTDFSPDAIAEAENATLPDLAGRVDLRQIPLITIDPADARDHDDAMWAEADPKNADGWHIIVAIADVAFYVRPGSALERDALERGNSTYFPDRVVPMLPEALSNELCSLNPGEDRACLAAHIWLDKDGNITRHKFERALMRSAASLNYQQTQAAIDGEPDDATAPLLEPLLKPLYGAFAALQTAEAKREPLLLNMPERRIILGDDGHISSVSWREQLDSHRLVEAFMIAANIAAAETLERRRTPCMYRIHEAPNPEKLEVLRDFLNHLDLRIARAQHITAATFNRLLSKVTDSGLAPMINQMVLRSQSQAMYSPDNLGHFGLSLGHYAHFTSPIRRYADLLVHRGLISALGLQLDNNGRGDGLSDNDKSTMHQLGEQISTTERRSIAAERDAEERYLAAYLRDRIGASFTGFVTGVTRAGLFVELEENGADGLIPISTLGADYFRHDNVSQALIGERTGEIFRLGDRVEVKLAEASPITGGIKFEMLKNLTPQRSGKQKPKSGRTKRPSSRKSASRKQAGRKRR